MRIRTLYPKLLFAAALLAATTTEAQLPSSCASVTSRANSNGGANSCPNASGTPYAVNFVGTSYAAVPATAKTGNLTLTYSGSLPTLTPFAITNVWITTTGTSAIGTTFGPAGVPTLSGGNTQVSYCFYGSNLPTAGTLSLQLTDPQTGINYSICSYDASCNSNCAVVANPVGLILPVSYSYFNGQQQSDGPVFLKWATTQEQNNKGFSIERSTTDSDFAQIAFIPSSNAGGNSATATSYSYADRTASSEQGHLTYRIRQQDLDGNSTYSNTIGVNVTGANAQPKIIVEGTHIRIDMPSARSQKTYDIIVYDTQGRTLQHQHSLTAETTLIASLPGHNIYYVAVMEKNGRQRSLKAVYLN